MIEVAALSTTGLLRGNNEDAAAIDGDILGEDALAAAKLADGDHLLVLADGIGGYEHGEIASKTAVEAVARMAGQLKDQDACTGCLRAVNEELFAAMRRDPKLLGMGTTIVGMAMQRSRALWFNVGDSRAYLWRGALKQLTRDHVPVARLPDGSRSHALTQWLGGFDEGEDLWPEVGLVELKPEDKLILCSDGLTDLVSDAEIAGMLADPAEPAATVRRLVDEVLDRGAPDNVTVILARLRQG